MVVSIVVDASVAVKWVVAESGSAKARALLDETQYHLIAPDLLYAEALNALWQQYRRHTITQEEVELAVRTLKNVPCDVVATKEYIYQAFRMAERSGLKATYDCFYLAVADWEEACLVTADAKFARAVAASDLAHRIKLLDDV